MRPIFILLVISLSTLSCEVCDEITNAACTLEDKLIEYETAKNSKEIFSWVSKYHGEAPDSELMNRFIKWGNNNELEMENLLNSWPENSRKETIERIRWAAYDSDQKIEFRVGQ